MQDLCPIISCECCNLIDRNTLYKYMYNTVISHTVLHPLYKLCMSMIASSPLVALFVCLWKMVLATH